MPNEMFGAPGGFSQAISDMAKLAQARHFDSEAMKNEVETAATARMNEIMQSGISQGPAAGFTGADSMDYLANVAIASGKYEQARKYASTASEVRHRTAGDRKVEIDRALSLIKDVDGPESYALANGLYAQMTGKPSPLANIPYNPQIVESLAKSLTSEKNKLLAEERKANIPYIEAKTRLANRRAELLGKTGKGVGSPSKEDVLAAYRIISGKFKLPDDIEAMNAARAVASRAKGLQNENRALDSDTAMNKALQESIDSGEFPSMPRKFPLTDIEIPGTSRTRFVHGGLPSGKEASNLPKVGEVHNSYQYLGGDPKNQASWALMSGDE